MAMAAPKPILLWAPPRSCSTAFERAICEHPDVGVFHEQLADCFYCGPDCKAGAADSAGEALATSKLKKNVTYATQLEEIAVGEEGKRHSFSKELSIYYQRAKIPDSLMGSFKHSILIRKPEKVLRSFWRFASSTSGSTYFNLDEAGFAELDVLSRVITEELGQTLIIVDADDLLANPTGMLRAWCAAVDLAFDSKMLSWEPMQPQSWEKWPGWHADAAGSSGFVTKKHHDDTLELPDNVRHKIEECQPIYERLYAQRLAAM
eukprot:CAMPEP_0119340796 /NCGR_PEP_ID=MMETSP1333-20130426/101041_1 /TAXON_ID=418940 /ORGANISM="Scyphosphaera apsteinii, Strain RCC1455" /LENGTH=261 /DNA_ID=CAMNT_0007352625 /DNA_START=234 /DNA_END=1019 /DNA_ORIENTATION=-